MSASSPNDYSNFHSPSSSFPAAHASSSRRSGGTGTPMNANTPTSNRPGMMSSTAPTPTMNGIHNGNNEQSSSSSYWKDDFVPLASAGQSIVQALRRDESSVHGDLYRRLISSTASNATTNMNDQGDGPVNHGYTRLLNDTASSTQATGRGAGGAGTFFHSHSLPLPPLVQQAMEAQKNGKVMMGLFASCPLAWLTLDDHVYVWSTSTTSTNSSTLVHYQVPSRQPIVSVGLAPPKVGVFRDEVVWCLVLTTKQEAIVCALANSTPMSDSTITPHALSSSLRLIPTQVVIPSDWVSFLSMTSLPNGRILLGGQDGHVYELEYELAMTANDNSHQQAAAAEDDFYNNAKHSKKRRNATWSSRLSSSFSKSSSSSSPRTKCRKLSHTTSVMSHLVPDFVSTVAKAAVGVLTSGGGSGGPIIQMVVDAERRILYTLSSRGWMTVLDCHGLLVEENNDSSSLTICSTTDLMASARTYLHAVRQCRMVYGQSSSSREAKLSFPGGAAAAQAGVGGMEGARQWLTTASQQQQQQRRRRTSTTSTMGNNRHSNSASALLPTSLHVVPVCESTRMTVVAVTASGLRYYLSTLATSILRTGPPLPPFGTPRSRHPYKPASYVTLFHIRAPPPMNHGGGASSSGHVVDLPSNSSPGHVDASTYYGQGQWVAALTQPSLVGGPNGSNTTMVVAASPDAKARYTVTQNNDPQTSHGNNNSNNAVVHVTPGGLSEVVSTPLATPGGRMWSVQSYDHSNRQSGNTVEKELWRLVHASKTPTDAELNIAVAPAFVPQSRSSTNAMTTTRSNATSTALTTTGPRSLQGSSSGASMAWKLVTNLLLSRPALYGIRPTTMTNGRQRQHGVPYVPRYRLSQPKTSSGFSLSAADIPNRRSTRNHNNNSRSTRGDSNKTTSSKSARLTPWLLTPAVVPLHPLALVPFAGSSSQSNNNVYAMNANGIHTLQATSVLDELSYALQAAGTQVRSDARITTLFDEWGYAEGCALCLILASSSSSNRELQERALRAANARAHRPTLTPLAPHEAMSSSTGTATSSVTAGVNPWMSPPTGYAFDSSSLCDGMVVAVARYLRPFWHKAAVVVTEGRHPRHPTKVELLIPSTELAQTLRQPLFMLQEIMKTLFARAVQGVPTNGGGSAGMYDPMDTTDHDDDATAALWSRNWQYRNRHAASSGTMSLSVVEAEALAQQMEERHLHALYRLVSRTVQLLTLLSHLVTISSANGNGGEWEWGLLHGIPISHLVRTKVGHERVEQLLHQWVTTSTSSAAANSTADSVQWVDRLSRECGAFFSPAAYHACKGFQVGQLALTVPPTHTRRMVYAAEVVTCFDKAAVHWNSPHVIVGGGRLFLAPMSSSSQQRHDVHVLARRALECDSPLAKACALLAELGQVIAIVNICLMAASNLKTNAASRHKHHRSPYGSQASGTGATGFEWEQGLYHRPQPEDPGANNKSGSSSSDVMLQSPRAPTGGTVTREDGIQTCFALILTHLSDLLQAPQQSEAYHLGEQMASRCAHDSDKNNLVFVHAFFEHLLTSDQKAVLLRIDSPVLEKWLASRQQPLLSSSSAASTPRSTGTKKQQSPQPNLLLQYFQIQGKYWQAAQVALAQADYTSNKEKKDESGDEPKVVEYDFTTRFDYLVQAENALARAVDQMEGNTQNRNINANHDETVESLRRKRTQVRERLGTARLQTQVRRRMTVSKYESSPEEVTLLSTQLLSVSDLFNQFALPNDMYDVCLALMCLGRLNDPSLIRQFWRGILCDAVFPCSTRHIQTHQQLSVFYGKSETAGTTSSTVRFLQDNEAQPTHGVFFDSGEWRPQVAEQVKTCVDLFVMGDNKHNNEDYSYNNSSKYEAVLPLDFVTSCLEELREAFAQTLPKDSSTTSTDTSTTTSIHGWPCQVLIAAGVAPMDALQSTERMWELQTQGSMAGLDSLPTRLAQVESMTQIVEESLLIPRGRNMNATNSSGLMAGGSEQELRSLLRRAMAKLQPLRHLPEAASLEQRLQSLMERTSP